MIAPDRACTTFFEIQVDSQLSRRCLQFHCNSSLDLPCALESVGSRPTVDRGRLADAQTSLTIAFALGRQQRQRPHPAEDENDQLLQEIGLVREKCASRMSDASDPRAASRRHYPPVERLAILELRAARSLVAR